jgi:hypothetical protein
MKIVYISLPISGKCEQKQRLKALDLQRKFESIGYEVVNPFDLADRLANSFRTIGKAEPSYEDYLKEDLNNLEDCTHIFLCEGWRFSKGCVREAEHALLLEKEILYETKYKF